MAKRNAGKRKKKSSPVNLAKAKLRGVFAESRNSTTYNIRGEHSYEASQRKSIFTFSLNESLLRARQEITPNEYAGFLNWAEHHKKSLVPPAFKNVRPTLASLSYARDAKELSVLSEAYWLTMRVGSNRAEIKKFIEFRERIEAFFWKGDVSSIYALFDEVAEQLGQSVWLVEARLSVEQMFNGLESQKKLLEDIRKEAGRGFIRFLSHRMSMRNEPAVTTQRFASNLHSYIVSRKVKSGTSAYLKYKLCHEVPSDDTDIAGILRFTQNLSTVDCYECLVNIAQELVGITGKETLLQMLVGALLSLQVDDFRVKKMHALLVKDADTNLPYSDLGSAELLLAESAFQSSLAAAKNFEQVGCSDVFQVFIASVCHSLGPMCSKSMSRTIKPYSIFVRLLSHILAKNPKSLESYTYLERTLRNFHVFPSCKAFMDVVRREYNPLATRSEEGKHYYLLNNSHFSPLATPEHLHHKLYSSKSPALDLTRQFDAIRRGECVAHNNLPLEFAAISDMSGAFQRGEHRRTIARIETLKKSHNYKIIECRLKPIEADTLISLGLLREAIVIFGNAVSEDKSFIDVLPFDALVNTKTRWPDLRQYSDEIALPILLNHAHKINPVDSLATLRRTAVDMFLTKNGLTRPSDIAEQVLKFGLDHVVYFLKYLCVSSILDMCKCLSGTKAVDEERLRVLGALIELDPINSNYYEDEILAISSTLRIREGIKVVDGSRIHVDLEGVSRWAHLELQESLSRYKSLVDAGVGLADDLDDVVKEFMAQSNPKAYLEVPKSEADDIIVSMLWELRERFLFDKPHGLNSYLSKRVRHNSIAGFLRGALDGDSLITSMSGGIYRDNTYWREVMRRSGYSAADVEAQLKVLEEFGAKFDGLTSYLKNSVLHIRRSEYPHGVIDLQLTVPMIHVARSSLQSTGYDLGSWFDVCVASFWNLLEPSLHNVRELLSNDYKARFIALFDGLRADLVEITGREKQCLELMTAINDASIEFQKLIDRAAEWFNRRQGGLSRYIYTMQEIVDISIQSALARHKSCRLSVEHDIFESMDLRADSLVVVADIILVIIGNITEHSGCRESATLRVSMRLDSSRNIINMRFVSNVSPEAYIKSSGSIGAFKADIASGAYIEKIANDKSSGLYKVASIVRPDAGGRIDFGFESQESFFVDLDLVHQVQEIELESYEMSEVADETLAG